MIFCLLTANVKFAFAQHSLSGIVSINTSEKKLLEGVEIFIPQLNRIDFSKDGGTYIIKGLAKGIYKVQFSKAGFKTLSKTISILDTATVIHISMDEDGSEPEDLLQSSESTVLSSESCFPVKSLSNDKISKSGSIDPITSLSYQPGIDKASNGNAIVKPVIRGMAGSRIQLVQYGTRIENQNWNKAFPLGVNSNNFDLVEVVKGPASLMYGDNALGGVLIFSDEKPPIAGSIEGDVFVGYHSNTVGLVTQAGLRAMSHNGIFYGLRFGMQSHTSYVQGLGEDLRKNTEDLDFAVNSKFSSQDAKAYVGMSKSWGMHKLSFSYLHQHSGVVRQEMDSLEDPLEFNDIQRNRTIDNPYLSNAIGIVSSENTIITGRSAIQINLAYQTSLTEEYGRNVDIMNGVEGSFNLNSFTFDAKYISDLSKSFGYSIGTQGMLQTNENTGTSSFVPDANSNNVGGYFLLRYDLAKWNFLGGARIDSKQIELNRYGAGLDSLDVRQSSVKLDYLPMSGSLGTVFNASERMKIKLNFASGFSTPDYLQLYSYGNTSDPYRFDLGNDSLEYEQSVGGDFGFDFKGNSISMQADFYYNQIADFIYLKNTGGYREVTSNSVDTIVPVYAFTQSNANQSGMELSIAIHPSEVKWLRLELAYAMQRGTINDEIDMPAFPSDKAVVGLQFQSEKMNYLHNAYVKIVFSHFLKQELVADYEVVSPAYSLIDLHLGGSIKIGQRFLGISISASNLLNESYSSHLSQLRPLGIRDMGRNVAIRLCMPFGIMKP